MTNKFILKLFLNGNMVASKSAPGSIASDTSYNDRERSINQSKYFKGKIDEVRVFNVALTDSFTKNGLSGNSKL
jgi:hypothetical protein